MLPGEAILTCKDSRRSDAGPYKVTLQNRYGKDSIKLNVNVLDKPGKPTGPIEATDICADAMTLNWLPPKDNGGEEITNYVVEKKDPRTGEWVKVGNPIGTSFRVRNLDEGQKYEFRVSAENQYGIGEPLQTLEPIIAKNAIGSSTFENLTFNRKVAMIVGLKLICRILF